MPTETTIGLMPERGMLCEVCGIKPAEEAHHCLYGKRKGVKELDAKENLQIVCRECHAVEAKSYHNKLTFWNVQCKRYGRAHMVSWHNALPIKVKEFSCR